MDSRETEFFNRLKAVFKIEAAEHAQAIGTGLLQLEKASGPEVRQEIVESIFRAAHSLKGAARSVDNAEIESLCQTLEDLFAAWRREESAPPPEDFDAAHRTLTAISGAMANAPGEAASEPAFEEHQPTPKGPASIETRQKAFSTEKTVRISVDQLDARLQEAEELLTAKLTTIQRAEDIRELAGRFETWRNRWAAVEPEAIALRQTMTRPSADPESSDDTMPVADPSLIRILEFLDWTLSHFKRLENQTLTLRQKAERDRRVVGKLVDDLLEESKKLLLLPFATLSAPFPKLVRDLCRESGKQAELVIQGDDVEMDKRILEDMKDPLIHLLRNAVDHGIETPEDRRAAGKPAVATITLAVSQLEGGKVEIFISDNGAGIDAEKVKESAVKRGVLSAAEASGIGEVEARALIFRTEISTSPIVTTLSGRGLGLAIVRERAEKLGGTVTADTEVGQGTQFRVVVPSMLATFRGILVEEYGQMFVIPTARVQRVARVSKDDIRTVEGLETISLDGRAISFVELGRVLDLPGRNGESPKARPVVIVGTGDSRVAFAVDEILEEQEVLVKQFRKPLSRVRNIAGATVLGSGKIAPILNVLDLISSAQKVQPTVARTAPAPKLEETRNVLVVEDSITSRMLITGILESAGYEVTSAVDGMEAFGLLRTESFDLVVSDVEMPRLNGFDLTAKIRADRTLSELPVVLVTALETRQDRERGIDVGANAYIVKSKFDQSDLLEAVQRLV